MIMYLIEQNLGKVCKVSHMVEFNSENYSLVLIGYHCKENLYDFCSKIFSIPDIAYYDRCKTYRFLRYCNLGSPIKFNYVVALINEPYGRI